jgi:hypothetical protein
MGPSKGFWADISKLHKRIMEERDEFRFRDLLQRAANLPITDPRRLAFFANSKDSFSKSPYSGLPVPNVNITNTQWSTANVLHFGVPIHASAILLSQFAPVGVVEKYRLNKGLGECKEG